MSKKCLITYIINLTIAAFLFVIAVVVSVKTKYDYLALIAVAIAGVDVGFCIANMKIKKDCNVAKCSCDNSDKACVGIKNCDVTKP
ncbi:MAG: hypothetical protein RR454_07150, partial [Clostridia bacterium]